MRSLGFTISGAVILVLALPFHALASPADEAAQVEQEKKEVLAGHSAHGEAFNEGPRQKAYLMGTTGNVSFPVTTESTEAQDFFNQGVGQLHGFWYFEAERSFRQAAALDPDCAMAYWGIAMANFENEERAKGLIKEAVKRKDKASDREKLWIDGYSDYLSGVPKDKVERRRKYIENLESIVHEHPDDLSAKAFLLVRLWQFHSDLPIVSHVAVNALLSEIFDAQPMHPANHYRIHLWDYIKPEVALESASRCGQSAPSIAHMWHMPGHIFSRLHRYADAAWQQEASARVDHSHMMRDGVLPDQIHNYAHNNEWLIRNLNHLGRVEDAIDLAKNMIELPRHPEYNTLEKSGRSATYGRARLLKTLESFELWDQLVSLCNTVYLEETELPKHQERRFAALGRAYLALGKSKELRGLLDEIRSRIDDFEERKRAQKKSSDEPETDDDSSEKGAIETAKNEQVDDAKKYSPEEIEKRLKQLRPLRKELRIYDLILRGENDFARELLEDLDALDTLHRARLLLRTGYTLEAEEVLETLVKDSENEVAPLAEYVSVLKKNGKSELARESFATLRTSATYADMTTPVFQRLRELADTWGHTGDWREEAKAGEDVGKRPPLESLGPFRWTPSPAPAWSLTRQDGGALSLDDYRGKPLVLIFYLGFGCLHCVEQLETFSPRLDDFKKAGLEVVAISTEKDQALKAGLVSFKEDGKEPGFPLLSNGELDVFKAFRCYDDFEQQALHGTFLIDSRGLIRWQDISYEPFNDVDFLLAEAKRLLERSMRATLTGRF